VCQGQKWWASPFKLRPRGERCASCLSVAHLQGQGPTEGSGSRVAFPWLHQLAKGPASSIRIEFAHQSLKVEWPWCEGIRFGAVWLIHH